MIWIIHQLSRYAGIKYTYKCTKFCPLEYNLCLPAPEPQFVGRVKNLKSDGLLLVENLIILAHSEYDCRYFNAKVTTKYEN